MGLSKQQQAVVAWAKAGKGSLKLEARAGCGKTFTLFQLIPHMAGEGFIGAYSHDIGEELKAKLVEAKIDWKKCTAGTMHSAGMKAWAKANPGVQVNKKKVLNIIDDLIEQCALSGQHARAEFAAQIQAAAVKTVSYAKARGLGALAPFEDDSQWYDIIEHFGVEDDLPENLDFARFVAFCQHVYRISLNMCREVIDFDDMILAPLAYKTRMWPKDFVFIDEAQDTNPVRRALALKMLKPVTGRLVIVGDTFQAVFGFTGADADSMGQIAEHVGAQTLYLTKTYRCGKAIVAHANQLVGDIEAHENNHEGLVRSIDQYSELTNDHTNALTGNKILPWFQTETLRSDDVVLCRNTKPLIATAYAMIRVGIACRVEGREIGLGLLTLARRWKSIKTLRALTGKIEEHKAREMQKWIAKGREERAQQIEDTCDTLAVMIENTVSRAGAHATIDDLAQDIDKMFGDKVSGVLTLSTVHKSKGREWNRVYLLGRNKFMPSCYARQLWQQEQERNLIYVAITRAINELVEIEVPIQEK